MQLNGRVVLVMRDEMAASHLRVDKALFFRPKTEESHATRLHHNIPKAQRDESLAFTCECKRANLSALRLDMRLATR